MHGSQLLTRETSTREAVAGGFASWSGWDANRFYDLAFSRGISIDEADLPYDYEGVFVRRKRMIVLASGLRDYQVRSVLAHELIHDEFGDEFCAGWSDERSHGNGDGHGDMDSKIECRTAKLTALRLIDPHEYANVERIYITTNIHLLACQLNVTEKIIRDYQRLVLH
jgi:hypothetical protein